MFKACTFPRSCQGMDLEDAQRLAFIPTPGQRYKTDTPIGGTAIWQSIVMMVHSYDPPGIARGRGYKKALIINA